MPTHLHLRPSTRLTVDGSPLRPDVLCALALDEVARVRLTHGNRAAELGELFLVDRDGTDLDLIISGEMPHVHSIGAGTSAGRLRVEGDVGDEAGARMTGGSIEITGNAGSWAGAALRGGELLIRGNAGDGLGSAYDGDRVGMRGGFIRVDGDSGREIGLAMRRGLIVVSGDTGDLVGRGLVAGSIFVFGAVGRYTGVAMKRGTLALYGDVDADVSLPPTYVASGRAQPPFLRFYLKELAARGIVRAAEEIAAGRDLERYNGDLAEGGKGEIWLAGRGLGKP